MLRLQAPAPGAVHPRVPRSSTNGSAPPRPRSAIGCSSSATTTSATRSSSGPTPAATRSSSSVAGPGARRRPTYIVFCGVHFMAESADILTGDHQRVILPDLNAGCSMADMADIDEVEECWESLADVTDMRTGRAHHLHELVRGAQGLRRRARRRGVHLDRTPGPSSSGRSLGDLPRPAPATRSSSSPTSTSAATPATQMGFDERRHARCGTLATSSAGSSERDVKDVTLPALEGPLLGAPAVHGPSTSTRSGPSTPTAS